MRKQYLARQGKIRIIAAAGCAALVISGNLALGDTWDNSSGDAKWFTATNWDRNIIPSSEDNAVFPAGVPGGDSTIDLMGPSSAECTSVEFFDNYSLINGPLDVIYGNVVVADGATARVGGAVTSSRFPTLTKNGAGTLVLTTPGTSLIPLTIDDGIVRLESAGIIGRATLDDGELELGGITFDQDIDARYGGAIGGTGTSSVTGTILVDSGGLLLTSSGTLSVGNIHDLSTAERKGINISGTGVVDLTQPSAINAHWTIDGGTLHVSDNSQLGKSTNPIDIDGGTFSATGSFAMAHPITFGNSGGEIDLGAGSAITENAALAGTITYPSELDIEGPGQLTLTQPSTFRGNTWIGNGATVRLENATALGVNNVGGICLVGSTLELDNVSLANQYYPVGLIGSAHDVIRGIGPNSALKLDYPLGTPQPFAMQMRFETGSDPSDALAVTCDILPASSDSMFTVAGAGTVTMSIPSYQGRWTVESGTLRAASNYALGTYSQSGTSIMVDGAGSLLVDNVWLSNRIELADGASVIGNNNAQIDEVKVDDAADVNISTEAATTLTFHGPFVGGAGSTIHIKGQGEATFTNLTYPATTYAGDWSLDGGTLQIWTDSQLGPNSDKLIFNGGTLRSHNSGWISRRELVINAAGGTIDTEQWGADFSGEISGAGILNKTGTGNLSLRSVDIGGLNINEGTTWLQWYPGVPASRVGSLTIANAADLDLEASIVVTGGNIGTWDGSAYTDLTGLLQTGRNGGTWNGPGGIVSSDSRAASGLCAIGIASASQVLGIDSTATGTWHGQTVTGTDSLIAFTYGGDANLDGKINIDDYGRIDSNVGQSGSVFGWYNGDFNYDGKINIDDYGIIDSNIGAQGSPLSQASELGAGEPTVSAVPEPASMGLLLMSAVLLKRRRRRLRID